MEKSLKDLISRLPIPGLKESGDRHIIAEILTNTLSIPITPKQISFKDGIVTVSVPPVVKSAIKIREIQLIESLQKEEIVVQKIQ